MSCSGEVAPVGTQVIVSDDWDSNKPLRILFVGEYPKTTSVANRTPFTGETGKKLRSVVRNIFGSEEDIGYTYLVHCETKDNKNNKKETSDVVARKAAGFCASKLIADIKRYKPTLVVGLGTICASYFFKTNYIGDNRGSIRDIGIGAPVMVSWGPSTFGKGTALFDAFTEDLAKAKLFITNKLGKDYSQKTPYEMLTTIPEIKDYVDYQLYDCNKTYLSYDVETHNTNKKYDNGYLTMQFANDTSKSTVIPLGHRESPFSPSELVIIHEELKRLFVTKNPSFKYWVAHGGKFEQAMCISMLTGKMFSNRPVLDTMAGAFLLNENRVNVRDGGGYGLEILTKQFLDFDYGGAKKLRADLNNQPLDFVADYGGWDATKTLALFLKQRSMAKKADFLEDWMKLLIYLYSPAFGSFAHMEYNGFYTSLAAVRLLKSKDSPILTRMREIEKELYALPSVQKVESLLSKNKATTKSLFGTRRLFDMNKSDSKIMLFKDVLNLKLKKSEKNNFQVNKKFFEMYPHVPEVMLFTEYAGLKKLSTSYSNQIYGYIDPAKGHADCRSDSRVRPSYFLTGTVTGRASCAYPNLQQIPRADSKVKALIKNMFRAEQPANVVAAWAEAEKELDKIEPLVDKAAEVAKKLKNPDLKNKRKLRAEKELADINVEIVKAKDEIRERTKCNLSIDSGVRCLVQLDYMANEVRWWAIFSQDKNLSSKFVDGKKLRDSYRKNPLPELKERAAIEGDIHIAMASVMFGVPVEQVTKSQRQQVKAITFGWMFGRSTYSIANELKSSQYKPEETGETEEQYVDRIQVLCDKYSSLFPQAAKWLLAIETVAQEKGYAPSLIGRRRHLKSSYLFGDDKISHGADRQARNSPIQSNASDAAIIAIFLLQKYINKHNKNWLIQNAVHDSCVVEVDVKDVKEYLEVAEKCFTTSAMAYMTKHWGVNFSCPLEVEFEVSQAPTHGWATVKKWDFSGPLLDTIIEGCLDPTKALSK